MPLSLSKKDERAALAKLRAFLIDGKEPEEIASAIGITLEDYAELLKKFFAAEGEALRSKSTDQVYTEYVIFQMGNIRDLTTVISSFEDTKQHSAIVGAIKARSDIYDKIVERGQEMGFIEKQVQQTSGVMVHLHTLSKDDLQKEVTRQLSELSRVAGSSDDRNIIDVTVSEVHFDAPPTPPRMQKAIAAKSSMREEEDDDEILSVPLTEVPEPVPAPMPRRAPKPAPAAAQPGEKPVPHARNPVHGGRKIARQKVT